MPENPDEQEPTEPEEPTVPENPDDQQPVEPEESTVPENPDDQESADLEEPTDSNDIDDEDTLSNENPIITVTLPVSIFVMVNPYNLKVSNEYGEFYDSIVSPEYSIVNYSDCGISVVATTTASATGGVVLSPYALNGDEAGLSAFIYVEATNESGVYSDFYSNNENQLSFYYDESSKAIISLGDASSGESIGYFKIRGQAVASHDAYWSDDYSINLSLTFNIEPIIEAVSDEDDTFDESEVNFTDDSESLNETDNLSEIASENESTDLVA